MDQSRESRTHVPEVTRSFTGISDDMIADAPRFREIAPEIEARLRGRLFIAHTRASTADSCAANSGASERNSIRACCDREVVAGCSLRASSGRLRR